MSRMMKSIIQVTTCNSRSHTIHGANKLPYYWGFQPACGSGSNLCLRGCQLLDEVKPVVDSLL